MNFATQPKTENFASDKNLLLLYTPMCVCVCEWERYCNKDRNMREYVCIYILNISYTLGCDINKKILNIENHIRFFV